VVKRRGLFNDDTTKVNEMVFGVKNDVAKVNQTLLQAEVCYLQDRPPPPAPCGVIRVFELTFYFTWCTDVSAREAVERWAQ
jgi:hypothetical protein